MTQTPDVIPPCNECGRPVRIIRRLVDKTAYESVRVCSNPKCISNGRERSLGFSV